MWVQATARLQKPTLNPPISDRGIASNAHQKPGRRNKRSDLLGTPLKKKMNKHRLPISHCEMSFAQFYRALDIEAVDLLHLEKR